ncbi:hypothetical protein JCM10213_005317 [Rhodosporidiobolus nylandii]
MFAFSLALASLALAVPALPTPQVFHELATGATSLPYNPKNLSTAAFPQDPPPTFSGLNTSAPLYNGTYISFDSCQSTSPAGVVNSVVVSPCSRSSDDEPCHFHVGETYLIQLNYTSYLASDAPRSSLVARDDTVDPSESYAYSGQTFDGCAYTPCPVQQSTSALYTYEFRTLQSPVDYLTFNVTQMLGGPSLFCAGFPIAFVEQDDDSGETWASVGAAAPSSTAAVSSTTTAAWTGETSAVWKRR